MIRETVSDVMLETLRSLGVRYLFANLGTDYPPIVESLAKYRSAGEMVPEVVLCAHENTAITAAHGYALATGRGQGVFVHVGVGTQNLGGSLHNAWTGRIPMLIFAGRSPVETRGHVHGGRDNPIHFFQDVRDQAGVIRQFCKWEFNLELPEQAAYAFQRAVRLMQGEPTGAVYMTAAREVLGMPVGDMISDSPERSALPEWGAFSDEAARRLAESLHRAERPLIITSYSGRQPEAVASLLELSETLRVPVVEAVAQFLNFPRNHPHHWGYRAGAAVKEADFILLLDTDVPWIPKAGMPERNVPVVQLDVDPLKPHITMWDYPVTESHAVLTAPALARVLGHARQLAPPDNARTEARNEWLARHRPPAAGNGAGGDALTVAAMARAVAEAIGEEGVLFDETITQSDLVRSVTAQTRPGTYFGLPGGSLGWGGGSALGYKLARPEAEVTWMVGDGSYLFSVPSSLYMTAARVNTPFLTVILNNGGWNAVKAATDRVYGNGGEAAKSGEYHHRPGATDALEQVAGAFGAYTARVETLPELRAKLTEGREAVARGQCAVINAMVTDG